MVYGTYNYSYWGESKPTNITGGGHIVQYMNYVHNSFSSPAGVHKEMPTWIIDHCLFG